MALIFCDGFDHYNAADIYKKWTGSISSPGIVISPMYARPPGGMGLGMSPSDNWRGIFKSLPAQYATFVSGFNINFGTYNTYSTNPWWAVWDTTSGVGTTPQLALNVDSTAHLKLTRGSTTLATSTNTFSQNTWYHVEIKATINSTTGVYEVRVNGSSTGWIPEATGQNTRGQSSNNWIDAVGLLTEYANVGVTLIHDDFYILDTTGSVANDFIGPQKIITVFPTGAGNSAQFTGSYASNFANVNETAGDGDVTVNQSSTAGHIDLFDFDNVPTGTISAIQHVIEARQDTGAARTLRAKTRISGTNYNGTSVVLAGSHVFITEPVTLNPADSAAWEAADVNGAEFGYELVS
jgi:hypothetical protein